MIAVKAGVQLAASIAALACAVLLAGAIMSRDSGRAFAALALIASMTAAGALGGVAFDRTRALRDRGWFTSALSWWITLGVTLVVLTLAIRMLLPSLHLSLSDIARIQQLSDSGGMKLLAGAFALFGAAMAKTSPRYPRVGSESPPVVIPVFSVFLLFSTLTRVANSVEFQPPEGESEALAVLPAVAAEARSNPASAKAQRTYGHTLLNAKRFDEAVDVFRRAISLDMRDSWAHNLLGWTLMQQQKFDEAIVPLRAAVQMDHDYATAHENLAWSLFQLRRWREAEAAYRVVLSLKPADTSATHSYAWVLMYLGRDSLALVQARRAIELDKQNPRVHVLAGLLHRARGQMAEAQREFAEAATLEKGDPRIWLELAVSAYLNGDARGADFAFIRAFTLDPHIPARNDMFRAMSESARAGTTPEVMLNGVPLRAQRLVPR